MLKKKINKAVVETETWTFAAALVENHCCWGYEDLDKDLIYNTSKNSGHKTKRQLCDCYFVSCKLWVLVCLIGWFACLVATKAKHYPSFSWHRYLLLLYETWLHIGSVLSLMAVFVSFRLFTGSEWLVGCAAH